MTHQLLEKYGRQVLGVGILLVSLIAALALVGQANSSVEMWGAKYTLGPGAVITENDLEIEKVSLDFDQVINLKADDFVSNFVK